MIGKEIMMGDIIYMPRKLSSQDAQEIIRLKSQDTSNIIFTFHAQERMEERGFSSKDVITVLRDGYVDEEPTFNREKNSFECKVTKRISSRFAGVVTGIINSGKLIIITVEWEDL